MKKKPAKADWSNPKQPPIVGVVADVIDRVEIAYRGGLAPAGAQDKLSVALRLVARTYGVVR